MLEGCCLQFVKLIFIAGQGLVMGGIFMLVISRYIFWRSSIYYNEGLPFIPIYNQLSLSH